MRAAFLAADEEHAIDMDTLVRATVREAREMGVLIAEERPPAASIFDDAPDSETADGDPSKTPPREPPSPSPRLVPITRHRK